MPTDKQIEAAARALCNSVVEHAAKNGYTLVTWDDIDERGRDMYREQVKAALEAAEQAAWLPIKDCPRETLYLIGKWNGHAWDYIHASYWHFSGWHPYDPACKKDGDGWYLPFDSSRGEDGTPYLDDDEQPTHFQYLTKSPKDPKVYKPIETAPKDGRWILIYAEVLGFNYRQEARWSEDRWRDKYGNAYNRPDPTHWSELV